MGKLILFNLITLDGFFAGPKGEIDWHSVDSDFNDFAIEQLNSADYLLFGRITYDMMASYWPTQGAIKDDPIISAKMNSIKKIVISKSLQNANWNNTRLIKENVDSEIKKLKQESKNNLFIFGSADLASKLFKLGLIDEVRVIIVPIVLGEGKPLFKDVEHRVGLKLINTKVFGNGNVLLSYKIS